MSKIIAFFGTRSSFYSVAGLIAILIAVWGRGEWIASDLRDDLAAEKLAHQLCITDKTTLVGTINDQNAQILLWQAKAQASDNAAAARASSAILSGERAKAAIDADKTSGPVSMNNWIRENFSK